METKITLEGNHPILSVRLLRGKEKFLILSFHLGGEENLLVWLSRTEALTLWNFLDEALEIPLNLQAGK